MPKSETRMTASGVRTKTRSKHMKGSKSRYLLGQKRFFRAMDIALPKNISGLALHLIKKNKQKTNHFHLSIVV